MMKSDFGKKASPLDHYRAIELGPDSSDSASFAEQVITGARKRRKQREIRRQSYVGITSMILLGLTLNGVDSLMPKNGSTLQSLKNEELAIVRADNAIQELAGTSFDKKASSFFEYLNSDLPTDPVDGLALYEDETVERALDKLASLTIFDRQDDGSEVQPTNLKSGSLEG